MGRDPDSREQSNVLTTLPTWFSAAPKSGRCSGISPGKRASVREPHGRNVGFAWKLRPVRLFKRHIRGLGVFTAKRTATGPSHAHYTGSIPNSIPPRERCRTEAFFQLSEPRRAKEKLDLFELRAHCSLAYSTLASLRIGMSGSAAFQSVKKSW